MNTFVANKIEEKIGDRPTVTINKSKYRENETMLALRWHGARDVRVEEVPAPAITKPKHVICKVTATTVCGSDLHQYHKEIMQFQKDEILGHGWMGVVEEVGSEVKKVKKGDRVVANFQIAYVLSRLGIYTVLSLAKG
jgi:NADPH:quinone reductase-like Zn-dependent oxidoreductase